MTDKRVLIFFFFFFFCSAGAENQPQLTIGQGVLRGTILKSLSNREIFSFWGIPYAKPPIGELRFREPIEPEPWLGILNATLPPTACVQYKNTILGSEDCLYLNVFTPLLPKENNDKLFSVLVYIHGGGYTNGMSNLIGPEYLLDEDIVLVTINYRLGPLGFLSTEDAVVPGNNGLKDQVQTLKWVQKNIRAFGGDPKRVTIGGVSAGGGSVHFHILSQMSKGLFSRALVQSGTALCSWSLMDNARNKANYIAQNLGCPTEDSKQMVDCLRNRPSEQITYYYKYFIKFVGVPYGEFGPVIEPPNPNAMIDKPILDIIQNKEALDVPTVYSLTSDEGLCPGADILKSDSQTSEIESKWDEILPYLLDYAYMTPSDQLQKMTDVITNHYMGKERPVRIHTNKKGFVKMIGDRLFNRCVTKVALLHAKNYKSPIYSYVYSFKREKTETDAVIPKSIFDGTTHGEDTLFTMKVPSFPSANVSSNVPMVKKLTNLWASFIQGNVPGMWTTVQSGLPNWSYLNIKNADVQEMESKSDFGDDEFWSSCEDEATWRKQEL